jgi:hypothetical protein
MSRRSAAFWTAITSTWVNIPKPIPKTTSISEQTSTEVSADSPDSSSRPTVIRARPATGKTL